RLALHLVAERLLPLQHAPRRCADGAVIEVDDVGIEGPVRQHRASEDRHAPILTAGTAPTRANWCLVRERPQRWKRSRRSASSITPTSSAWTSAISSLS